MENQPIVVEEQFSCAKEKIWSAVTDKDEMEIWYFKLAEFKAEEGFIFKFTGGPTKERQYLHICEITEVIPHKRLTYSWKYDGYPGISYVSWEILENESFNILRLTHSNLDSFPQDNPDFSRENFVEGWNHILHKSLSTYLN